MRDIVIDVMLIMLCVWEVWFQFSSCSEERTRKRNKANCSHHPFHVSVSSCPPSAPPVTGSVDVLRDIRLVTSLVDIPTSGDISVAI